MFHPAVENWFQETHGKPSEPQRRGWPEIRAGRHTLIAAPTGSGKTLSAFLAAIDELVVSGLEGTLKDEVRVLYISPLKALSNDIEKNLRQPLEGIRRQLEALGLPPIEIRSVVRTGDTSAADRNQLRKAPPHILVTTPESLYILLTSESGRRALASVRTVIVDEIHAMVTNKRGAHLALSLERLSALTEQPLIRVGLSATQKPIEEVARFLVGSAAVRGNAAAPAANDARPQDMPAEPAGAHLDGAPPDCAPPDCAPPDCAIVDCGHKREMRLSIELPASPLEAVMSAEVWGEVYDRIAELVQQNTTTLVFVGNRRLAERLCAQLGERLGEQQVAAHHGSLSKETRLAAEQKLKAGQLKALVATASLELGIDIGAVDLVCQVGSTRSIARLLQRVGRAGHQLGGTPDGKVFPLSRNDLVECAALVDSVRRGELDAVIVPPAPLDILAQQVVAMAACESWDEDALFARVRRAYPYRALPRERFDAVLGMLADGYNTSRGRRSALIRRDAVTRQVQGRKAARLVALTNGGAIPDNTDYRVVLEPENIHVGSVGEDFAIESMGGDIFQLGNASWRILKVEPGLVRVADAQGQPPTIPFWLGEGPARSDELSLSVSRLRSQLSELLESDPLESELLEGERLEEEAGEGDALNGALRWLTEERGFPEPAARQLVDYLAAAQRTLGALPTQRRVVMERFFDEAQNTHLVIHSSFGARVNRAWGLALRKRFCKTFNFELQAAATEDAIILSLGPTHSFELATVGSFLKSASAESVLIQALLDAPMFEIRWRHNATRSLATPRFQSGKKVPASLVRIRANDLLATAFPDQQACLENLPGEREIPDHPLVQQTIQDCLTEAMDCGAFLEVLRCIERGELEVSYRDLTEPSPLAHEILNANPYAFLDPAPLEERRTQAVMTRRFFDPKSARDLGQLDADAIERVRREAWPEFGNADELSDALYLCGFYVQRELEQRLAHTAASVSATTPAQAAALFEQLVQQGRATRLVLASGEVLWTAAERLPQLLAACPGARPKPELELPAALRASVAPEDAWRELLRARLESLGPLTLRALAAPLAEPGNDAAFRHAEQALLALETQGSAMIGHYTPGCNTPGCQEPEWCMRGLLARIHRYTLERLRREIEPVTTAVFMRFLFDWQRVSPDHRQLGQASLPGLVAQLEGFEAAAGSWESALLPARVADYDPAWLDGLCLSGQLVWGRAEPPANAKALRSLATTPIVLAQRENWSWIAPVAGPPRTPSARGAAAAQAAADVETLELSPLARQIEEQLRRGPRFFHDLRRGVPTSTELELALSELVAAGRISSDSFSGMRGLLPSKKSGGRRPQRPGRRPQRRTPAGLESAGRWSLLEPLDMAETAEPAPEDAIERWARLLLRRYGVIFRALLERENAPPWRDLLREYRRLEARGEVRGGRFVQRHAGEQFALPEAIPLLRSLRRSAPDGREVCLSACDPLNLLGTLLPGERVTATPSNFLLFRDGLPIAALEGGKVRIFEELAESSAAAIGARLRRGPAAFEASREPAPPAARRPEAALPASLLRLGSRRAS